MEKKYKKGSEWRKWDLHIHTPMSIEQHYGGDNNEAWEKFIQDLEKLPEKYKVIGINDYIFVDGYKKVLEYKKDGRLENIDLILPIIEYRLSIFGGKDKFSSINYHIIFSDKINPDDIQNNFINLLKVKVSGDNEKFIRNKDDIQAYGKILKEKKIVQDDDSDLNIGFKNARFDIKEIKKILNSSFGGNYLFAIGKSEWEDIRWNSAPVEKKDIINNSHFVFIGSEKLEQVSTGKKNLKKQGVNNNLLHFSDAHYFSDNKSVSNNLIGKSFTWIKADPTFEGLKQIIYEPEERVFIGENNPEFKYNKPYFHKVELKNNVKIYNDDDLEFEKNEIIFNKNLVTIVGGRGEGKSTLINYLGNSLKQYENKDFKLDDNFIIEYHKLNKEGNLEKEDIQKFKSSERENNELDFIFIKQGDLKEKTKKDLSENLKKMLKIENTSFSEKLNNNVIFNINQEIENIEKWKLQKDGDNNFINFIELQENIIKKYQKLINNLQNSKNKKQIENYNNNLKKISGYKNYIFQADKILEKVDNFIEDIRIIDKDNIFENIDLSEYKNKIELKKKEYENKINKKEEENKKIEKELQKSGISGDLTSLLENITKYQNIIDQAEKKKKEIELEESKLLELKSKRSELGERIKEEYKKQKQEIDEKWNSFLSNKTDEQKKVIERILFKSKLKISGNIIFDKKKFYELLWDSLHHGQYKKEELEEKFKIIDLDSFSNYIKNTFNDDYDNLKFKKQDFLDLFFNLDKREQYLRTEAEIKYDGKDLSKLSAGQKGTAYLRIHLANSAFDKPIIFDQPEDDLDNQFIMSELVDIFKELKKYRQIIIVTYNANLVVNSDAEQVIVAENKNGLLTYISGSLENKEIQEKVCKILEGGKEAFDKRKKKYNL